MANIIKLDADTAETLDCSPGDEITLTCAVKVTRNDESGFEGECTDVSVEGEEEDAGEDSAGSGNPDESESESESETKTKPKGMPGMMLILGKMKK